MNFIVSSSALLKQLQLISGILNSNNSLPILDNFLFEVSENNIAISASDLETTMTTNLKVEAKDKGIVAIPAKLLLDSLKSFPEQPLTFSVDMKTFLIEINSDFGRYSLAGQDGAEFPKTPSIDNPSVMKIDAYMLASAIEKTIFASGNDELRPVMSGVFFQLSKEGCIFVATDAHKLVKCSRSDVTSDKSASFIMPKKSLNLLKNVLSTINEEVTIEYNDTNALYSFGSTKLTCRLIDGKYPNYEAVIPKENPNKLTVERSVFLNAIKRVSIFSSKTTHQVRLKVSGSELTISAEDIDFSNAATERLTCQYEGEDMEIGFNSRFLMEMLSNLRSEQVNLEMSAPNRAGILTPLEKEDDNEDVLMLVMPVMLNN